MSETHEKLHQTPLYDDHVALGARMVPFGGWDMPVQYEGILAEYEQTRKGAALFDISHMGEFIIEGDYKESGLDRIVTMRLDDLPVKSSRYGMILNEQGGVIDDLIVFRMDERKWFLVVNGATTQKDADHIQKHLTQKAIFHNVSFETGKLDLQGPDSRDVLKKLVPDIEKLNYFRFDYFDLLGENVLISRTGYTGELGYEIFYPWNKTQALWKILLEDKRVKPAGLGARDILRLEMGYSLYGHELGEDISPIESGLKRFIDFDKKFIGKEALADLQKNAKRKIVGITSDSRRSPRPHQKVFLENGDEVGEITSGSFSPAVEKGIGLALIRTDAAVMDQKVFFGDDKNKTPAMITGKIFYKQGSVKK